jgi:hypothetical protein
MQTVMLMVAVLTCFQVKHFAADYLLQPAWMLRGKDDLYNLGGYAHAGLHAIGSLPALAIAGIGITQIFSLAVLELIVHYGIDYGKARLSVRHRFGPASRSYWAMHGADQLLHHLTYAALILAAFTLRIHDSL